MNGWGVKFYAPTIDQIANAPRMPFVPFVAICYPTSLTVPMIIARNILLIFLALLVQASWLRGLAIYGIAPDIAIITLVFIAISRGQIEGTVLGFASGLLIDLYDPSARLGINALGNSMIGFCVGYSRVGIVAESLRVQAAILFFATLLHDVIFFVFSWDPIKILSIGLGTSLYTAALGTALSFVFARVIGMVRHAPRL